VTSGSGTSSAGFPPEELRPFLEALFAAAGASNENAHAVVDHLIDASLVGLHSHGIIRVPEYLDAIDAGIVDPRGVPSLVDDGAVIVFDAQHCFGQVAGAHAVDAAATRVARNGAAVVAVRGAGHLGRIGAYVEALARRGYVALGFCSTPTRFHNVAWFGAKEGRLGTNPIAYAFPTRDEPVVADFSTSAIPEGRVRYLRNLGQPTPDGVLHDADGAPSTDPNVLYEGGGTIQPLGGELLGHKGSALGLLSEMMATLLGGEEPGSPERFNNLTLLAFAPPAQFDDRASNLARYIHSAAPIDPARPPLLPGEPEARTRASSDRVTVDPTTWEAILQHADRHALSHVFGRARS
jgi:hydroxycarboxylate dehydrogenase B